MFLFVKKDLKNHDTIYSLEVSYDQCIRAK